MTIREVTLKDAAALSGLLGQLGYPCSTEIARKKIEHHRNEGYRMFISENNGDVTGFIAMHWYHAAHLPAPVARITAFCVDASCQGKGTGSQLLQFTEKFLKELGCYKVEITSNKKRKETHAYYLHRQYEQTSEHFVKFFQAH